jgi:hypothetical protein
MKINIETIMPKNRKKDSMFGANLFSTTCLAIPELF